MEPYQSEARKQKTEDRRQGKKMYKNIRISFGYVESAGWGTVEFNHTEGYETPELLAESLKQVGLEYAEKFLVIDDSHCKNCHRKLEDSWSFCPACAEPVTKLRNDKETLAANWFKELLTEINDGSHETYEFLEERGWTIGLNHGMGLVVDIECFEKYVDPVGQYGYCSYRIYEVKPVQDWKKLNAN